MVSVVDIQFRPGQKVYFFDPADIPCVQGDHVIIDTARGAEYGVCASGIHRIPEKDVVAPLRKVLRIATAQDERIVAENRAKEARAESVCAQKIQDHGLDMQLVCAECAFDGSKILFYFTADERVDFRDLVKDLAGIFHTRIELRQIGVRDKAKMVGGLGICGRPFCCASFLDDFQPVSIKMAKSQNLSLNPTKISGTCGRLMCCLKYEQDTYEALIRTSPKLESFVDTPEGRGTVVEADILRQRVKVRMENNPETIGVFENADVAVLRSGKAKKTDAPIPADLAPISGSGKKSVRKPVEEADGPVLESIRFRYSTDTIAEERQAAPAEEEAASEEAPQERSPRKQNPRRDSRKRPRRETPEERSDAAPDSEAKPQKPRAEGKPGRSRRGGGKKDAGPKPAEAQKPAPARKQDQSPGEGPENTGHPRRRNYRGYRRGPKPQSKGDNNS
ncbi:MAG: stage 0 sporulation family protein [Oscillospiraceae bacterium]|nr:stage 0 sporulation family protein [Oscillospiraceae bacterium]